jgi:hypothetical protein
MVRARSFASTAVVGAALSLAAACGSGSSGGAGNGNAGGSPCDALFDMLVGNGKCPAQTPLPAAELSRIKPRFEQSCQNALALPGSGLTSDTLSACLSALQMLPCHSNIDSVPACQFIGSLGGGAACVSDAQCQSGSCDYSLGSPADGGFMVPACGTCDPLIPVGGSCVNRSGCAPGSACDAMSGSNGSATCTKITQGAAGASCDDQAARCADGLYCDPSTHTCTATKASGAPCSGSEECTAPLVCGGSSAVGMGTTCQPPGQAGAGCTYDEQCAPGLGCDTSKMQCATVSWAAAGQPCGGTVRCLVGGCPTPTAGSMALCPKVVPDGQPCDATDPTSTCDTFASCMAGKCVLDNSQTCM